jgi:DNA repair photolyase
MHTDEGPVKGRGAASNPPNRFELIHYERDPDAPEGEETAPATQLFRDATRSIIAHNDSPDVGFEYSINPYRGCEHGCTYCFARPFHEYLGFSSGLDFETKIMVKEDAPVLLRRELSARRWRPRVLAMSGVTDAYQPVERRLRITRRCLEVLAEFRNPVGIVTKNGLVARDADLLAELARHQAAAVFLSITTLDGELARNLEPRATQPAGRLRAIETLSRAGVPVGVMTAPVIPGLNDHEVPAILAAAAQAGARFAGHTLLRLPYAVGTLFEQWLDRHAPASKDKVLGRLREAREGKLSDSRFGRRMRGKGALAEQIEALFRLGCRKAGLNQEDLHLSTAAFRRPDGQRLLFE